MLTISNLTRRYGQTIANDRITLELPVGRIVGLLGENGAGKTTLLSILAGYDRPNDGHIVIRGERCAFRGPGDALAAGIALVHQHLSLVSTFSVREQLVLSGWNRRAMPHGLPTDLNMDRRIEDLPIALRQRVEIAKALITNPSVLLLDEPTSILGPDDVDDLFKHLRVLANAGTTVVIVSHKLGELLDVADEVQVMRRGRMVDHLVKDEHGWPRETEDQLLAAMFGEPTPRTDVRPEHFAERSPGTPGLRLDLSTSGTDLDLLDLTLGKGTILGIVGIDDQGQSALVDILTGGRFFDGHFHVNDVRIGDGDRAFFQGRVGHISEDRIGVGSIGVMTLADNLLLGRQDDPAFARFGMVRRRRLSDFASTVIATWNIRPANPEAPMATFSGGNIQRMIVARELSKHPAILVAQHPTHGLDTGTVDRVWSQLRSYAGEDGIVLAFLSDINEAFAEVDQVAVMYRGKLSQPIAPASTSLDVFRTMMVRGWE